jgi:hypothetical protein
VATSDLSVAGSYANTVEGLETSSARSLGVAVHPIVLEASGGCGPDGAARRRPAGAVLEAADGVGRVTAASLVHLVSELGQLNALVRHHLAGLAPAI